MDTKLSDVRGPKGGNFPLPLKIDHGGLCVHESLEGRGEGQLRQHVEINKTLQAAPCDLSMEETEDDIEDTKQICWIFF